MKKYRKLVIGVPLACMLLASPISAFAAPSSTATPPAQIKQNQGSIQSKNTDGLNFAIEKLIVHALSNRDHANYAPIWGKNPDYSGLSYNFTGDQFSTTAKADSYLDAGDVELLIYRNGSDRDQTQKTIEKQMKTSESFTYSNKEGAKLGASVKAKVDVGIPFVAAGTTEVTASTEFSYEHTSSNTSTKDTTITFPSQNVICAKGFITKYIGKVQNANFSGVMSGKAEVSGTVSINVANLGNSREETKTISVADVFKYSRDIPGPTAGYEYDAQNNKVFATVDSSYSGVGGHYQTVDVEVTPIGKNATPRKMPLKTYEERVKNGTLKELF
ncbi:toxin ETX/toxin MTX2 [Thermoactinomyces sp. DSM 45891]|uniref:ETX/MTX2 family pore-forming toxin n=1 Tax=Thermoactinomyces sp. DSM 45891 TaxID=1761907 RepID=UPI0009244A00|nr:ETX/MTX2 family pore-forming toxin [Thermoactinomyces sp. DSM 45891]SFX69122.1 toxin ETX/toxin MTX2 [Thermoactinomyces sp. DSM 45891]